MNYGPLVFLAAFFGLAASWVGFVLAPQMQVGQLQQTNTVPANTTYPVAPTGVSREGASVYRANGCASCHTEQLVQNGTVCDVLLNAVGTNRPALMAALKELRPGLTDAEAQELLSRLPQNVITDETKEKADGAVKTLNASGAKAEVWIRPVGPDIARGWGRRRTVADDYLFDYPVMLGSHRVGPDLANVGLRQPDVNWHLRHLYAPRSVVKDSIMPPYRYLFEKRKIQFHPSPDALQLPPELAAAQGYEIVPLPEAKALASYLASLRADAPLFVAPLSEAPAPAAEPGTDAPAGSAASTNAPAINAPAK
jgi:cbb3-type cytochrome oxidase cytochrome c subunit